ncbi:MAG: response regulator transcription factor [Lachnospiraceae bacterium]|jgi:two-component system alkaline phosphatase synthesis response regulator PhoP|nr:response regulator transcription factor [Lachnospiraceae bacterium]
MIYLVEDDENIRELVIYTLRQSGLQAEGFERPSEFDRACAQQLPRLVLLDIMLPEEDGLSILRRLRANPAMKKLPVMMLTAKSSEYDKVVGLDQGADDYLPKPFGMMELLARVKALLRRAEDSDPEKEYVLDELYVCPEKHMVTVEGAPVALTKKEFDILCMLLGNRDIVLSRDRLLNTIWGYDFDGENRTVDVHIRTLRSKLGVAGAHIETVRGIGYRIR